MSKIIVNTEVIDSTDFILHATIVLLPWPFLCSLLIGLDGKPASPLPERRITLGTTTTIVVLLMTLLVYALFCVVQFRFLFAGLFMNGSIALPDGLTYSDYARNGFFQLLAVTAINLTIFAAHTFTDGLADRVDDGDRHHARFCGVAPRPVY